MNRQTGLLFRQAIPDLPTEPALAQPRSLEDLLAAAELLVDPEPGIIDPETDGVGDFQTWSARMSTRFSWQEARALLS